MIYHTTILGRTGVDLFFVLSGFLITGIILDRTRPDGNFLCRFYFRRMLRIVPSYAVLVLVFWWLVASGVNNAAFNADIPWWRHLTFTQNLWMSSADRWGPSAISITWSVAIEEQFYLFWPFLVILVPRRQIPILLAVIAVGSCAYRAFSWIEWHRSFMPYVSTLCRLDGLAAGSLIACIYRNQKFDFWMEKNSSSLKLFFISLCVLLPAFFFCIRIDLQQTMYTWGHTYLSLFYGMCLLMILKYRGSTGTAWLRGDALRGLGAISYTVYIFHPLFIQAIFTALGRPALIASLSDACAAIAALLVSLIWSKVSFRWFEAPFTDYGRRWAY